MRILCNNNAKISHMRLEPGAYLEETLGGTFEIRAENISINLIVYVLSASPTLLGGGMAAPLLRLWLEHGVLMTT